MRNTKKTARIFEQGRLVYYRQSASADYWDQHWQGSEAELLYKWAEQGIAGPQSVQSVYSKYLPKDEQIIEAGCGIGQVVIALRQQGYNIEGVDFAEQTIAEVSQRFPELPVRTGDVTQLDVPDNHYGAYISIGVIEHRQAGPEPFLKEAYRVLHPGAYALISVPYLNLLRRWKGKLGLYRDDIDNLAFYQYAYSLAELRNHLMSCGFEWVDFECYDPRKGLKDEISFMGKIFEMPWISKRLHYRLTNNKNLRHKFSHMIMAICRKPE